MTSVCRISWPWSGLAVWWSAAAEKRTISDELWSERHLHTHPCSSTTRGFWDLQMLCIQQSGTGAVLCQTHRATPEHQIYNVKLEEKPDFLSEDERTLGTCAKMMLKQKYFHTIHMFDVTRSCCNSLFLNCFCCWFLNHSYSTVTLVSSSVSIIFPGVKF